MADEARNDRLQRVQNRVNRVAAAKQSQAQRVRVLPRDEEARATFRYPPGRMGFREEGSVEWPMDQFTKRRLREGSVVLEQRGEQPPVEEEPQQPQPPE